MFLTGSFVVHLVWVWFGMVFRLFERARPFFKSRFLQARSSLCVVFAFRGSGIVFGSLEGFAINTLVHLIESAQ